MATFLKICKDVARECGISGGAANPTTVVGQTGELARVVGWVTNAYEEIQGSSNFRWLRKKFTLNTLAGVDTYDFSECIDVATGENISRFKSWRLNDRENPPKIYLASTGVGGEIFLSYTEWDHFEYLYKTGSLQNQTTFPYHISVDPDDKIRLGIKPDNIYTVTGDYHRSAQILAADGDVPEMPAAYHSLIKYTAMEF